MSHQAPVPSILRVKDPVNGELRQLSIVVAYVDRIEEKEDGFCLIISDTWGFSYLVKEKFQVLHTLRFGFSNSSHLARQN
jgi:C4-type Zn-finger protein